MPANRVKWRCPKCQKTYAVRAGRVPNLCPDCAASERKSERQSHPHVGGHAAEPTTLASLEIDEPPLRSVLLSRRRAFPPNLIRLLTVTVGVLIVGAILCLSAFRSLAPMLRRAAGEAQNAVAAVIRRGHVGMVEDFDGRNFGELKNDMLQVAQWHEPFNFRLAEQKLQGIRVTFTSGEDRVYIGDGTVVWGYVSTVELWPHFRPDLVEAKRMPGFDPKQPLRPLMGVFVLAHKHYDQVSHPMSLVATNDKLWGIADGGSPEYLQEVEETLAESLKAGSFVRGTPPFVRFGFYEAWVPYDEN